MKRLILIFTIIPILFSCNKYVQIATFSSDNVTFHEDKFAYVDDNIAIEYLFYKSDGIFNFAITNLSEEDIYIDLTKSIFVLNGQVFDYAGYSTTKFSAYSHATTFTTPDIIVIPSNCYRVLTGFEFNNEIITHQDIDNAPTQNRVSIATFAKDDSPWKFLNKITVIIQDQEYTIENLFYISKLSNEIYNPNSNIYEGLDNNQHYQIYSVNNYVDYYY
ncbi:MAG: hypothetical protein IKZ32_01120 [Alistipes sp.]|nr:hypothetical protein [Alistipes sp.]